MKTRATRKAIGILLGCAAIANVLVSAPLPARADGDKKDGGGKKIIIVVGPVTKTHDHKK